MKEREKTRTYIQHSDTVGVLEARASFSAKLRYPWRDGILWICRGYWERKKGMTCNSTIESENSRVLKTVSRGSNRLTATEKMEAQSTENWADLSLNDFKDSPLPCLNLYQVSLVKIFSDTKPFLKDWKKWLFCKCVNSNTKFRGIERTSEKHCP